MKHVILLALLALSSCTDATSTAFAGDRPDLRTYPPRDAYERQVQDYQRYNYDSQRNGPLQETLERQRREERRQEEYRQDTTPGNTWGSSRDNSAGQYGAFPGEGGGQCLYGC